VIRDTEGRPETVRYEQLNTMLLNEFLKELKTVQELKSAIQKQEVIFRREITGWPSPDARYAIRKKFSDEYTDPNSKVIKAELIETKSGKVIVDLTREDIGAGRQKEGENVVAGFETLRLFVLRRKRSAIVDLSFVRRKVCEGGSAVGGRENSEAGKRS
jgi:hypothetical protein